MLGRAEIEHAPLTHPYPAAEARGLGLWVFPVLAYFETAVTATGPAVELLWTLPSGFSCSCHFYISVLPLGLETTLESGGLALCWDVLLRLCHLD